MPLFLDRHDIQGDPSPEAVAAFHVLDMDVGPIYGVKWLTYWYKQGGQQAFCLAEAPTKEALQAVHRASHGKLASEIIEVDWSTLEGFMGRVHEVQRGEVWECASFRTMLYVEVEEAHHSDDDEPAKDSRRLIGEKFESRAGLTVPSSTGVVGCFPTPLAALESALSIQQSFGPISLMHQRVPTQVRLGISIGQPVFEKPGLFESSLDEAALVCSYAKPGGIVVTKAVRDACSARGYRFSEIKEVTEDGSWLTMYVLEALTEWTSNAMDGRLGGQTANLTPREVEVLRLIAAGKTNKEIAQSLVVSESTVATHVRNILSKVESANRAEAAIYAVTHGLISSPERS